MKQKTAESSLFVIATFQCGCVTSISVRASTSEASRQICLKQMSIAAGKHENIMKTLRDSRKPDAWVALILH